MEQKLAKITDDVLASYRDAGGINNIDGSNLPSKRAIASICEDLLQLLFPGFHDQEPIHSNHLKRATSYRIQSIAERLKTEVCKSLRLAEPGCPEENAERVVMDFLSTVPQVRGLLRSDVETAFDGDPAAASYDEIILAYPFLEAVAIQRSAHMLYCHDTPLIPRMMTEWAHSRTGIDIHPGAHIYGHFFIDHGTGVVVGETSVIGHHVKLYQGVSLVARSLSGGQQLKGKKRHPTIEDHVTIYAGTTIIGGDTVIGEGSTIGANVFLTHSVPPRSLVFYEEKQLRITEKSKRSEEWAQDWMI
ncbi:MAG: serine O-acetyltransferase [Chthoniobacter sp.]|jgi:serine O-acetyltransferase|nr:serine O-acetyltransferase [Chthoniobacter sp.]